MDSYTEKLIERTRQRREMLNQKLGKTPDPAPRKRRTPLGEETANVVEDEQNDDSPKRQCLRETENELKPDTPAISSVRSRMQNLSQQRGQWGDTREPDSPVPVPRKSLSNDLDEENAAPVSRRGRLAALARDINNWEEDLSHPTIQKVEEEKKPRWEPPRAVMESQTCRPAPAVNSPKKYRAPAPPSATVPQEKKWSPVKSPVKSQLLSSPIKSKLTVGNLSGASISIASPMRKAEQVVSSPLTPQVRVPQRQNDDRQLVEQIPVNAKGLNESPSASEQTDDEPTAKPVSERFNKWAQKSADSPRPSRPVDPALTPVASRMANWERKVNQTPVGTPAVSKVQQPSKQTCTPAQTQSQPPPRPPPAPQPVKTAAVVSRPERPVFAASPVKSMTSRPVSSPSFKAVKSAQQPTPKVDRLVSVAATSVSAEDPTTRPVSERMAKWQEQTKLAPVEQEPTAYSVNARMSAWETMSSANQVSYNKKVNPGEQLSSSSPQSSPARPPAPKKGVTPSKCVKESISDRAQQIMANTPGGGSSGPGGKSCPLSPSSASGTMKTVHQRLMEQTHNSSKSQDIMEKLRQERMAELGAIQNRWKNGILRQDGGDSAADQAPQKAATPSASRSDKQETIREKARADFDNKMSAMGFDLSNEGEQVASYNFKKGRTPTHSNNQAAEDDSRPLPAGRVPPAPPLPTGTSSKPPPAPQQTAPGTSIYRIISQKGGAPPSPLASQMMPAPQSRPVQRHASTNSRKVQFEDSFDSTDESDAVQTSSFDDESPSELESESDVVEMRRKPVISQQQQQHRPQTYDEDDVSLSAFVPDSVRRQSILPPAPDSADDHMANYPSETSDDEPRRQPPRSPYHSRSQMRGQRPQDSSSSLESTASSDRGEIDDLLEEAMDSEEDRTPVPKMRQKHYASSDTSDSDRGLMYSVSAYRSRRNLQGPPSASKTINRHSEYVESGVVEENIEMPQNTAYRQERKSVHERMQELQELVQQEQNVIMQTSNALNQCCGRDSYFAGSTEQVECNRLLLVACQKRQSYMAEIQRLKTEGTLEPCGPGPKGSLTISDIRLPLKREFVTKIGTSQDTTTYFFIILIRKDTQVICTQMLSTHDPMMRGSLDFPNLIKLNGITGNFRLTLEIYSLSVSKEPHPKDKKKPKTPKKSKFPLTMQSPGGPMAVRTTSFSHITTVPITMKSLDKPSFNLDRLPYLSPLHGSIYLRLKCLMEANVEERGFLTMFEDVSGLGAWHRRWVVLARNKLCYWKYPDDENRKDPMGMIDLKRCITEKVGLIPRDICARPHTFELMTVRQPRQGERDTLVSRTYNTMTTVKFMLSADTKEERIVWCNKTNRALANIRAWHSDALPPVKIPAKQS